MAAARRFKAIVPVSKAKAPKDKIADGELRMAAKFWLDRLAAQYRDMVDQLDPGEISTDTDRIAKQFLDWKDRLDPDYYGNMTPKDLAREEAEAALHLAGFEGAFGKGTLDSMHRSMERALDGYVKHRVAEMRGEPPPPVFAPSPNFSTHIEKFLEDKRRTEPNHRGYTMHTERQTRATLRLFVDFFGDRPVREIQRRDVGWLREQLLLLPQSFGKSPRVTNPRKAISAAEAHDEPIRQARKSAPESALAHRKLIPRLTMKTVKRHFSSLSQYWEFLAHRNEVDANVFLGWPFPGTRSSRNFARDQWGAHELRLLFEAEGWKDADPLSAEHWFPLIALHSGMRLDEIAALRVEKDVVEGDGVLTFLVQEHIPAAGEEFDPEAREWRPKTIAGVRRVPVHPWLIAHGIRALIERRRMEGAKLLFPRLRPSGDDGKLSNEYSRRFSKFKTSLGLSKRIVFHGFRITFRHLVSETRVPDEEIDAVTGHESVGDGGGAKLPTRHIDATVGVRSERGVGAMYERPHLYKIDVLRRVVEAFKSPLDLSFLEPLDEAIRTAPSDKEQWGVNLPPKVRRKREAAKPSGKGDVKRNRVSTSRKAKKS